jgi:WD40 repeat protein
MNNRQSHTVVELFLTLLLSSPILVHGVTITPVPGSPFTSLPNGPSSGLAYSPNAKWLACANSYADNSVSIYAVASNGVITQIPGSPFATNGAIPECVAYSPDNLFLVAGNYRHTPSTISLFSVDQSTGALTQIDPTLGAGNPSTNTLPTGGDYLETIFYSPNGKFVAVALNQYLANSGVGMCTVNTTTGALTYIGAFTTQHDLEGDVSDEIAFSPDSKYIAQANSDNTNTITIFTVDQNTGELGPYNGSVYGTDYPVPGASGYFSSIAYSPNGNLLVVSDENDNLFTFTLNNGVPTFAATIAPTLPITYSDTSVAFSPDSQFIALANDDDSNIYVFSVAANGTMAQVAQLSTPENITDLVFSPSIGDPISFLSGCGQNGTVQGFIASYTVPVLSAGPPSPQNLAASRTSNVFLLQTDLINLITWSAPTSGTPVAYNIYRDATLIDLIAIVPATSPLQFYDHNRQPNVSYTYYITAVDSNGNQSLASSVSIVG